MATSMVTGHRCPRPQAVSLSSAWRALAAMPGSSVTIAAFGDLARIAAASPPIFAKGRTAQARCLRCS